jgi:hypothetical protein
MWRENVEERDTIKELNIRKGRRNISGGGGKCKYEAV